MSDITVLDSKFINAGTMSVGGDLSPEKIHVAAVHQVVKATLASRRQGNASTKTKGLVRGGGKKPYKQKGTGRARQGSIRSSLMVGGGTMFGPTPRDFAQKVNKKLVKKAILSVLADKYQAGKLTVVDSIESNGKTKEIYQALSARGLLPALVVVSDKDNKVLRAVRNLQYGKGIPVEGFSVYEAVKYENLIIEKRALETLLQKMV